MKLSILRKKGKVMDGMLRIVELLGEDNAQKLKDGITEILLEYVRANLEDFSNYLLNFEKLFDEVCEEVCDKVKDKMIKKYTKEVGKKFEELFQIMIQKI